jgi:purine-binding chemotaxis protein CheW
MTDKAKSPRKTSRRPKKAGKDHEAGKDGKAGQDNAVDAYAQRLAAETPPVAPEPEDRVTSWVSFHVQERLFALPVEVVEEVLKTAALTRVPHAPAAIRGVANMRGRVLPVLDLALRMGLLSKLQDEDRPAASQPGTGHRLLVVEGEQGPVGLLIDRMGQMLPVRDSEVQPVPDRWQEVASFSTGVVPLEAELLVLLNLNPILDLSS